MTSDVWNGASADWTVAADWSSGLPNSSSDVSITLGVVTVSGTDGTVASVVSSSQLYFANAGNLLVSGTFTNSGTLALDQSSGQGGAALTVGGLLSNSGFIQVGPNNDTLSTGATLTATGGFTNFIGTTLGTLQIFGDTNGTPQRATVDVGGAAGLGATGTLEGNVVLNYDALLEFASSQITTIAAGSNLTLDGTQAFVADSTAATSNSALTGLTTITGGLYLNYGGSITTTAGITNTGTLALDQPSGAGGSTLTVGGVLTNSGFVQIGPNNDTLVAPTTVTATGLTNFVGTTLGTIQIFGDNNASPPELAKLNVTGAAGFGATGRLVGNVLLNYDALLEFTSGEINTIGANSNLTIDGTEAFVADSTATTSNSALTGLTTITGGFFLNYGASLTTTAGLTNTGQLEVDSPSGAGGSALTIGGVLTNSGFFDIGPNNNTLGAATTVTATGLTNFIGTTLGQIDIFGDDSSSVPVPIQATLNITSAAGFGTTGVLYGNVLLNYDSLLEFASGQIATIAANSSLAIDGPQAFVADANATTSNSALTGLTTITGGLYLSYGATVTTTASLTNTGTLAIDQPSGAGGSRLTVGGVLTNSGYVQVGPNNQTLSSVDALSAEGLVNQSSGTIDLYGLNAGVVGTLALSGAASNAGTVTIGVDSELTLTGSNAYTQTAGTTNVYGALDGQVVIDGGTVVVENGGSINGPINFNGSGTLSFYSAPSTPFDNFAAGDFIDLKSVAYAAGDHFVYQSSSGGAETFALENSSNAVLTTLAFDGAFPASDLTIAGDGSTGTLVGFDQPTIPDDFLGAGVSGLTWENASSGATYEWSFTGDQHTGNVSLGTLPGWSVIGTGDFTGSGTSGVIWQNAASGATYEWLMTNGQHTGDVFLGNLSGWTPTVGYFDGNGVEDIVWQYQATGATYEWTMSNGQHTGTDVNLGTLSGWSVIGAGDFTGNGTSDLLWRNDSTGATYEWLMTNGQHTGDVSLGTLPGWSVIGTGDFTGAGTDDIVWQNDASGAVYEWLMQNGQHVGDVSLGTLPGWDLVGTGDYAGTGTDGMIWQNNASGATYEWQMSNGQHVAGADVSLGALPGWNAK